MIMLDSNELFTAYCKAYNKFGLYISFDEEEKWDEIIKACPFLTKEEHYNIFLNGFGYVFFDTKEEMEKAYESTVGDDGPTKLNSYNGLARVYALTCDNTGQLLNENT